MTSAQIIKALDRYIAFFKGQRHHSIRAVPDVKNPNANVATSHIYWMCLEAKTFAEAKPAKAMRWLCFIQGVMWSHCGFTIEEFKDDNRGED